MGIATAVASPKVGALVRVSLVLALTFLDLGFIFPDLVRTVHPIGELGFAPGRQIPNEIIVFPGPAARAGVVSGDTLVLRSPAERLRFLYVGPYSLHPGTSVPLEFIRGGNEHRVTVVSEPYLKGAWYAAWINDLCILVEVFWFSLATFLVLRRPNETTWSFFLFSVFTNTAPAAVAMFVYPISLASLYALLDAFVFPVVHFIAGGVLILSVGNRPAPRWHVWAGIVLTAVAVMLAGVPSVAGLQWAIANKTHTALQSSWLTTFAYGNVVQAVLYLALLFAVFAESTGVSRQRVKWIFVGYAVWSAWVVIEAWPDLPPLVYGLTNILVVVLPLCMTYLVLKYRLVDIDVFIRQTLVYSILSVGVIVVFGVLHWGFSTQLDNERLGAFADIAVAIALGFWFSNIHRSVDRFVESVFFRRRHLAERHLHRLAKALPQAPTEKAISTCLIDEPVAALPLTCAALYKSNGGLSFERIYERGWSDASSALSTEDPLVLRLKAERDAVILSEFKHGRQARAPSSTEPDIAIPIFVNDALFAVAIYGVHENGTHLDGDEIVELGALSAAASAAYTRLEARAVTEVAARARQDTEAAQREAKAAQREIAILRSELEALRERFREDPSSR